jgi:hypothetical protein
MQGAASEEALEIIFIAKKATSQKILPGPQFFADIEYCEPTKAHFKKTFILLSGRYDIRR